MGRSTVAVTASPRASRAGRPRRVRRPGCGRSRRRRVGSRTARLRLNRRARPAHQTGEEGLLSQGVMGVTLESPLLTARWSPMSSLDQAIHGLRQAVDGPRRHHMWRWLVRNRISTVKEALRSDRTHGGDAWLAAREMSLQRERSELLRELARVGPVVLHHRDIEHVHAQGVMRLTEPEGLEDRCRARRADSARLGRTARPAAPDRRQHRPRAHRTRRRRGGRQQELVRRGDGHQ